MCEFCENGVPSGAGLELPEGPDKACSKQIAESLRDLVRPLTFDDRDAYLAMSLEKVSDNVDKLIDELARRSELFSIKPDWTKDKPTKPGFYWTSMGGALGLVYLVGGDEYIVSGDKRFYNRDATGELEWWMGPIEEPIPPEEDKEQEHTG